jgi:hypothetical protein
MSSSFLESVSDKLGRCARCMRLSAGLVAASLGLWSFAWLADAGQPALLLAAGASAVFGAWLLAHGLAWVIRGPDRASGCSTCAQRARRRRREQRWLRVKRWLQRAPGQAGRPGGPRPAPLTAMHNAPAADARLLPAVEACKEFDGIADRLAHATPADMWQSDGLHFFLYELLEVDGEALPPHAVFVMRAGGEQPVLAYVVHPDPAGGQPRVDDLRVSVPDGAPSAALQEAA